MYFLRVIPHPNYYDTPDLWQYFVVTCMLLGMIVLFYLLKYFFSKPSKDNALDFDEANVVISPFLIEENRRGDLSLSVRKYKLGYRIIAIALIIFFVVTPLSELFPKESLYYFSCMF
ncbi:MAG: hypothetical protein AAFP76_03755 [Bacteroidota bacterium]